MKKFSIIISLLLFSLTINAQDKYFAIDGSEWKCVTDRDVYEVMLNEKNAQAISDLASKQQIGEDVREALEMFVNMYNTIILNNRALNQKLVEIVAGDEPTMEVLSEMGIYVGSYQSSNKETFYVQELSQIFDLALTDRNKLLACVDSLSVNNASTQSAEIEIMTVLGELRTSLEVNIAPKFSRFMANISNQDL